MITLRQWFVKNARKPIAIIIGGMIVVEGAYLVYFNELQSAKRRLALERIAGVVGLGIEQSNRILIESALMIALNDVGVKVALICKGSETIVSYPPGMAECKKAIPSVRWEKLPLVGRGEYELRCELPLLAVNWPFALLAVFSFLVLTCLAVLLVVLYDHLKELFYPLQEGLSGESSLAIEELEELRKKNRESFALREREKIAEATYQQARQVAHDIRSPLSALKVVAESVSGIPESHHEALRNGVGRIQEIANQLLRRPDPRASEERRSLSAQSLSALVSSIIDEKRVEYARRSDIKILGPSEPSSLRGFAEVQPTELKRALSNLITNAVESIEETGRVCVSLSERKSKAWVVDIEDNGKGIPESFLPRLAERGASFGKNGGWGLGLYHAKRAVESWGGTFGIQSTEGKGTVVTIEVPKARELSASSETPAP